MTNFTYKGFGRIYVKFKEDIQKVEELLKELDLYEYENYYPEDLITTLEQYPSVVYIGKFDIHKDFESKCKENNIPIFVFDAGIYSEPTGAFIGPLSKKRN